MILFLLFKLMFFIKIFYIKIYLISVSPKILHDSSLITFFLTFPVNVNGNPSTNKMYLGILKWESYK